MMRQKFSFTKDTWRKGLSLFLALCLCVGSLEFGALTAKAAEDTTPAGIELQGLEMTSTGYPYIQMYVGDSFDLASIVKIKNDAGDVIDYKNVSWADDYLGTCATLSEDGIVTAVSPTGESNPPCIYVGAVSDSDEWISKACTYCYVYVYPAEDKPDDPSSADPGTSTDPGTSEDPGSGETPADTTVYASKVTLNKSKAVILPKKSVTLKATVTPSNVTEAGVTWKSSNPKVATVKNGKVTGVKTGKATITATSKDGKKKAACTVYVASVKLSKTKLSLKKGKSATLKATAVNSPGDKVKSWKSSNTKVATVKSGKVTGKKKGTATITVTMKSGAKATCKVTIK